MISPNGRFLYALPMGRDGLHLDISPTAWKRHACRIAGRKLTRREWRDVAPQQPYRRVCR